LLDISSDAFTLDEVCPGSGTEQRVHTQTASKFSDQKHIQEGDRFFSAGYRMHLSSCQRKAVASSGEGVEQQFRECRFIISSGQDRRTEFRLDQELHSCAMTASRCI